MVTSELPPLAGPMRAIRSPVRLRRLRIRMASPRILPPLRADPPSPPRPTEPRRLPPRPQARVRGRRPRRRVRRRIRAPSPSMVSTGIAAAIGWTITSTVRSGRQRPRGPPIPRAPAEIPRRATPRISRRAGQPAVTFRARTTPRGGCRGLYLWREKAPKFIASA